MATGVSLVESASAPLPVRPHEDLLTERLDRALLDLVNVDPAQELLEHVGVRVGDREAVAVVGSGGRAE